VGIVRTDRGLGEDGDGLRSGNNNGRPHLWSEGPGYIDGKPHPPEVVSYRKGLSLNE
jgi:hypothetical protein